MDIFQPMSVARKRESPIALILTNGCSRGKGLCPYLLERVVHRKLGSRLARAELFARFDATKNGCFQSFLLLLGEEGCA